jgi:cytochrome P450
LVTRGTDVRAALLDSRLSVQSPQSAARVKPRRGLYTSLLNYDPAHHARVRRLATQALTPRRVAAYQPEIETIAARLLDAQPPSSPIDIIGGFARPFSFLVACHAFGVAEAAGHDLYQGVCAQFDQTALDSIVEQLEALSRAEVDRRRREPTGDLLSSIVSACTPDAGVSEDELISLFVSLLLGAVDSTAQMLGLGVVALLTHPAVFARVRDDPSLVPQAVDELLRWDTPAPFSTRRWATDDIRIGETLIPAGSSVLLAIAAANRDPECHDDPNRLDIDRSGASRHLTFGLGPYYCPGASLAKLELTVALTTLITRYPQMRLSTPAAELKWRGTHMHRRLAELFVVI